MPKCPHCDAEITSLNYTASTSGWEWGSLSYSERYGMDWNVSNSEVVETCDYTYQCPECETDMDMNTSEAEEFLRTPVVKPVTVNSLGNFPGGKLKTPKVKKGA